MIAVIDYGMGNLRSVQKALERVGGDARLVRTPQELSGAQKIVFPGVAAFGDAMEQLRSQKLVEPIIAAVRAGTPYLGFCLGLQLLFEEGTEDGEHKGLGILGGKVVKFDFSGRGMGVPPMCTTGVSPVSSPFLVASSSRIYPQQQQQEQQQDRAGTALEHTGKMPVPRLRIPHMGWNQVHWHRDCPMLRGIEQGAYAYFAHSYYPVPTDPSIAVTTTDYGYNFTSSVWKDNIFATQFHPEKSQAVGLKLLENFVKL
jgi:glutamine amidotransferase